VAVNIRVATIADLAWIDQLQKLHNNMVGFMPRVQLEGYAEAGSILIAESPLGQAVGYVIAKDRYFKRDDVGVIFQLNVAPGSHRKLIGAALIKAVFERAAYGCRLFSCWCAQDIAANHFWESIGFVPLAFRTGGRGRGARAGSPCHRGARIHIFWQRRVREGDTETPFWFPSQTNAGAIAEDRLVFPIPPGTHWSDAKPIVLPGVPNQNQTQPKLLPGKVQPKVRPAKRARVRPRSISKSGLWFAPAPGGPAKAETAKKPEPKRRLCKNNPQHVAAARELRDRYLEAMNSGRLLPSATEVAKYDVSRTLSEFEGSRQLEAAPRGLNPTVPLLKAA
jgi:GNAT superfamily N-acetyltransferase